MSKGQQFTPLFLSTGSSLESWRYINNSWTWELTLFLVKQAEEIIMHLSHQGTSLIL